MWDELRNYIVIALIGVVLIGGINIFLASIHYNTTRAGEHTGYITAVEQGGVLFHNYRVYFKTDNSSSQEDTYCINDDNEALAKQTRLAVMTKNPVRIQYEGVRGIGFGLCDDDEITNVSFIGL